MQVSRGALLGLWLLACVPEPGERGRDAGPADAHRDAALVDLGRDAGVVDGQPLEAAVADQVHQDRAAVDATTPDRAGASDLGTGEGRGIYDHQGPAAVTVVTRRAGLAAGRSADVDLYLPDTAGARPVVIFSPGLLQPRAAYAVHGQRLASHGILVVIRSDPGLLTSTQEVADDVTALGASWLAAEHAEATSPLCGRVDLQRLGLAGHSRGGKATLIAAEHGLAGAARAWFGLDPVDAEAFSGDAMARDALASVGIPTGFLGAEISSACSAAADNYAMLYALAPSPSVKLTGVGAGHTQFQDPSGCIGCSACTPEGTADGEVVLGYALRYLTAFFARELLGDSSVGPAFEGAGAEADLAAGRILLEHK